MTEKPYSRYAWIILVVSGLLELQFALTLALTGPAAIDNANVDTRVSRGTRSRGPATKRS